MVESLKSSVIAIWKMEMVATKGPRMKAAIPYYHGCHDLTTSDRKGFK